MSIEQLGLLARLERKLEQGREQTCQSRRCRDKDAGHISEVVDRDAVGNKPQGKMASLPIEMQSTKNHKAGLRVCQLRSSKRQIVEQENEFVNQDAIDDKVQSRIVSFVNRDAVGDKT